MGMETYVGYVTAWRWWEAVDDMFGGYNLESTGVDYVWNYGENTIRDYIDDDLDCDAHSDPGKPLTLESSHGFHAFKPDMIEDLNSGVFGRVALYGDVCEHEYGYRAEKARILDLWCIPALWDDLKHFPKMRGTFTTVTTPATDSIITDESGKPYTHPGEEYIELCLTSETPAELIAMSPSDFPMKLKILHSHLRNQLILIGNMWMTSVSVRQSQFYPSPFVPFSAVSAQVGSDGKFIDSELFAPETVKSLIVEPEGDYCSICHNRILSDEAVAISRDFPSDYLQQIAAEKLKMIEKKTHLTCEAAGVIDGVTLWGGTSAGTGYYPLTYTYGLDSVSYAGITRSDTPPPPAAPISPEGMLESVTNAYLNASAPFVYPTYKWHQSGMTMYNLFGIGGV